MEIIFNLDKSLFESEFKEVMGFVDADIPLRKIKPDLLTASREIRDIIGNSTYDAIIANYKLAEGAQSKDLDLIQLAQYSIGTKAYALYAPTNDLAHSPNGRKMRTSEDEKTPFEWMMVRDDDQLQMRSYTALDALIEYMDENFAVWKDSAKYLETKSMMVNSSKIFDSKYIINSRSLYIKLVPAIKTFERKEISYRIPVETHLSIISKLNGNSQDNMTANETNILEISREALVFHALAWGIKRFQINLFPNGILQMVRGDRATISGRSIPEAIRIDQVAALFKKDSDAALLELEELMTRINPPVILDDDHDDDNGFGFNSTDNFIST